MGMIGHLKTITTEELARFLECSTEDEIVSCLYGKINLLITELLQF